MYLKKYSKIFFSLVFSLVICTSCSEKAKDFKVENSSSNEKEELFTSNQEEFFENGYEIDNYTILLTEMQKKSIKERQAFVENNFFGEIFEQREKRIDKSKKINLVLYSMHFSPENQTYTLGIFLTNTSNNIIDKLSFDLDIVFKGIDGKVSNKVVLEGDSITQLMPNSVIVISITGDVYDESIEPLLENTIDDVIFEISNLEINGEKMENSNEN